MRLLQLANLAFRCGDYPLAQTLYCRALRRYSVLQPLLQLNLQLLARRMRCSPDGLCQQLRNRPKPLPFTIRTPTQPYWHHSIPQPVRRLMVKARNPGYGEQAVVDLIALTGAERQLALHAHWALLLLRLDQTDTAVQLQAQKDLDTLLAATDLPDSLQHYLPLLTAELAAQRQQDTPQPPPNRDNSLYVDYLAQQLHRAATATAKIEALNAIFAEAGLATVAIGEGNHTLFDSLTPFNPVKISTVNATVKVTVIIACYNAAATIKTALQSLQQQSWRNLELIVVDDASTDTTLAQIEPIAQSDSRIKIIAKRQNSGPYHSRNLALQQASGELMTVADADDWHHPQKIELQVQQLLANPDFVANIASWLRATPDLQLIRRGQPYYRQLNISSLMCRKLVFSQLGGWDEVRFGADTEFYHRLQRCFGAERIAELDAISAIARVSDSSLTVNTLSGYNGVLYGARKEYAASYRAAHQTLLLHHLNYQQFPRVFPVPRLMQPGYNDEPLEIEQLYCGDFRDSASAERALAFLQIHPETGLVYVESYDGDPEQDIDSKLRQWLLLHQRCCHTYGEQLYCEKMYIDNPRGFELMSGYLPTVTAQERVFIHGEPSSLYIES
ncbi:glycosyltransferase family 2 protein [Ectothiorhodospiraceae bacterium BW-2]|nr:glycosyltransferase family 2 protein [Ectothiorhodospiraceae bacterium BW-2]